MIRHFSVKISKLNKKNKVYLRIGFFVKNEQKNIWVAVLYYAIYLYVYLCLFRYGLQTRKWQKWGKIWPMRVLFLSKLPLFPNVIWVGAVCLFLKNQHS